MHQSTKDKCDALGIALLTICWAGCIDREGDAGAGIAWTEWDSAGVIIVDNEPPAPESRLAWSIGSQPTIAIGSVDSGEADQFFRVTDATRLSDGRIVIANTGSNELRVFNPDGTHAGTWGGMGEGPGEFTSYSPTAMVSWSGDSVAAPNPWDLRLFLNAREAAEAASDEVVTRPSERVFVDPPDSIIAYLGAPPWGLAHPIRVAVSAEEDHAYVMDFGAQVVRQFTLEGEFVRDYGTGRGQGPGEFLNLSDVEVDPEGQVWTLDPAQGRVQVFDRAGEVVETIRTPGNATAFELTPTGDMVLMTLDSLLLRRVSRDGTVVRRFGRLVDDQYVNSIAVWGFIDVNGSNVFYSGVYGGFLGRWSVDDGALHYLEPTVMEKPFPTPVRRDGTVMVAEEDRYGVSFGISARQDTVYVLGHGDGKYLVDVYEAERGEYQYSIPILTPSESVSAISVTRDHLIVTADTLVTVWNRAN